jgi:hypothetical protein
MAARATRAYRRSRLWGVRTPHSGSGSGTGCPQLVVRLAGRRIAEYLASRDQPFEFVGRLRIADVGVGMAGAGPPPVGPDDLVMGGGFGHTENGVVVAPEVSTTLVGAHGEPP